MFSAFTDKFRGVFGVRRHSEGNVDPDVGVFSLRRNSEDFDPDNAALNFDDASAANTSNVIKAPTNEVSGRTGADDMKFDKRDSIKEILDDLSTFVKVGNIRHSPPQPNNELERAAAEISDRHGWVALLVR